MARKRDFKAEYRRRIERGLARGLSRSQARGHPKANEQAIEPIVPKGDPGLEAAIREMNQGTSLTAAARSRHISAERLRRFLVVEDLAERDGRRWVATDTRPRQVPVMTGGNVKMLTLAGYEPARLAGEHWQIVSDFVRTNNVDLLKPFEGKFVLGANGRRHPLETDPNALHRIASMDTPPFHEIYAITSTS